MALNLDQDCQEALELAKRALPPGGELDAGLLMRATYNSTILRHRFPALAPYLTPVAAAAQPSGARLSVHSTLQPVLQSLVSQKLVTPLMLLTALIESEAGRAHLARQGMGDRDFAALAANLRRNADRELASAGPEACSAWRSSEERQKAMEALSSYGRMLTFGDLPQRGAARMEGPLQSLVRTLSKMGRKNAIVVGFPGTGKSALIYELARRIVNGDEAIPPRLREMDIFELSPAFLRSGASMVGQYDERVKALIEILKANSKIILFVDEIHTLFKSGLHEKGPFSEANESFKTVLGKGEICCIGCTTIAEYRHYLEPDGAFARRFAVIRLEQPDRDTTIEILRARLPKLSGYYSPLAIPEELLARIVDLTDEYLPSRYQPDKSIQLLDEACAFCVTSRPPRAEVDEQALWQALEDTIGHSVAQPGNLTEESVFERLKAKVVGQDETLQAITRAFVSGLGSWSKKGSVRGVFLFCGPTGVGKTETANVLAQILGGGRDALLRVDCNTLQGSGNDPASVTYRLLGVPAGYIGYARGQGGVLSRIRDLPQAIVLFDELEKADPSIGKLLLQILDEGRVEDTDGNLLDFRRSFIIFTTNAGCRYSHHAPIGFDKEQQPSAAGPEVDLELQKSDLIEHGFGQEFLGRIRHTFAFKSLSSEAIRIVVLNQLKALRNAAELRGLELHWDDGVVEHMVSEWQPRFGVRHLTSILRNRITEQLGVAEAQGELKGVRKIRLALLVLDGAITRTLAPGIAVRRLEADVLVLSLA
ncbi:MAG: AAA family ATPase [Bryobacteraceae bacterium]|nr:AAA family ATPase [Bryobacteraceae bacterium]